MSENRKLLRHTLATVAYRGAKALREAPPEFADFCPAPGSRSAREILAHVGDLFDCAVHLSRGENVWKDSAPLPWEQEVARFHAGLAAFDAVLASDAPLGASEEKLFQGPIADALQHIGQITYLRRLAGCPIRGENYWKAEIEVGRVGADQRASRREFD